jgi:hypothetical protein
MNDMSTSSPLPDRINEHLAATMLVALVSALILPADAPATPWSFSTKAAAGHVVGATGPTGRIGLEAELIHPLNSVVGLGFESGWWEGLGTRGFSYGAGGLGEPTGERQRAIAVAAVVRARARVIDSRPYLLLGAGEYLMIRRYQFSYRSPVSRLTYAPGLSLGVGISGSTRPAPVLQVRWHRVFVNSETFNTTLETTDILLVSAGVSFN